MRAQWLRRICAVDGGFARVGHVLCAQLPGGVLNCTGGDAVAPTIRTSAGRLGAQGDRVLMVTHTKEQHGQSQEIMPNRHADTSLRPEKENRHTNTMADSCGSSPEKHIGKEAMTVSAHG